jgi:hypothetical protein
LGKTQQCGRVKLVKGIITFPLLIIGSSTEIHILTNNKTPVKIQHLYKFFSQIPKKGKKRKIHIRWLGHAHETYTHLFKGELSAKIVNICYP